MSITAFKAPPTSEAFQHYLDRAIEEVETASKYLIRDKAKQFWCPEFKDWCDRKDVTSRFGAVGKKGSIAVIERFIRSLKRECLRVILVPLCEQSILGELAIYAEWHNEHRPHSALTDRTPAEVYRGVESACQLPRFEPRARSPREAPCSSPQAEVAGQPGAIVKLEVEFQSSRRHLPIVSLKLAA